MHPSNAIWVNGRLRAITNISRSNHFRSFQAEENFDEPGVERLQADLDVPWYVRRCRKYLRDLVKKFDNLNHRKDKYVVAKCDVTHAGPNVRVQSPFLPHWLPGNDSHGTQLTATTRLGGDDGDKSDTHEGSSCGEHELTEDETQYRPPG